MENEFIKKIILMIELKKHLKQEYVVKYCPTPIAHM
jgi:hypothetical protein